MGTFVSFFSSNGGRELCLVIGYVDLVVSSVATPFSQRKRITIKVSRSPVSAPLYVVRLVRLLGLVLSWKESLYVRDGLSLIAVVLQGKFSKETFVGIGSSNTGCEILNDIPTNLGVFEGGSEGFFEISLVMKDVYLNDTSILGGESNVFEVFDGMPQREKDTLVLGISRPVYARVFAAKKTRMLMFTVKGFRTGTACSTVEDRDANGVVLEGINQVVIPTDMEFVEKAHKMFEEFLESTVKHQSVNNSSEVMTHIFL